MALLDVGWGMSREWGEVLGVEWEKGSSPPTTKRTTLLLLLLLRLNLLSVCVCMYVCACVYRLASRSSDGGSSAASVFYCFFTPPEQLRD